MKPVARHMTRTFEHVISLKEYVEPGETRVLSERVDPSSFQPEQLAVDVEPRERTVDVTIKELHAGDFPLLPRGPFPERKQVPCPAESFLRGSVPVHDCPAVRRGAFVLATVRNTGSERVHVSIGMRGKAEE